MKPVERTELLELGAYEQIRDRFRARVIAEKEQRRVALGDNISVVFENRDTVLYQIQEMLRTERITAESGILHELETYNQLIPASGELSATIFLEYPEKEQRDNMLVKLAGVEGRFYLDVGGAALARERSWVRNETNAPRTDRTTAVQYTKFALGVAAVDALRAGKALLWLGVDHPAYRAEVQLGPQAVRSLALDFAA